MPAIVFLTVPQISLLTRTTFDRETIKEIEKHPNRFIRIGPAREEGDAQMARGENIAMITPLTEAQFQAKLEKLKENEAAAKERTEANPKIAVPRPGFRIPGGH